MMDVRKIRCTVPCQVETVEGGCHCAQTRDEIERLRAALRDIIADSYSVYAIQVARAALEVK